MVSSAAVFLWFIIRLTKRVLGNIHISHSWFCKTKVYTCEETAKMHWNKLSVRYSPHHVGKNSSTTSAALLRICFDIYNRYLLTIYVLNYLPSAPRKKVFSVQLHTRCCDHVICDLVRFER